jgi:hypothetical protein
MYSVAYLIHHVCDFRNRSPGKQENELGTISEPG